jgi:hypothetical protein
LGSDDSDAIVALIGLKGMATRGPAVRGVWSVLSVRWIDISRCKINECSNQETETIRFARCKTKTMVHSCTLITSGFNCIAFVLVA